MKVKMWYSKNKCVPGYRKIGETINNMDERTETEENNTILSVHKKWMSNFKAITELESMILTVESKAEKIEKIDEVLEKHQEVTL